MCGAYISPDCRHCAAACWCQTLCVHVSIAEACCGADKSVVGSLSLHEASEFVPDSLQLPALCVSRQGKHMESADTIAALEKPSLRLWVFCPLQACYDYDCCML